MTGKAQGAGDARMTARPVGIIMPAGCPAVARGKGAQNA